MADRCKDCKNYEPRKEVIMSGKWSIANRCLDIHDENDAHIRLLDKDNIESFLSKRI